MTNKLDALMKYTPGGEQAELFNKKLEEETGWDRKFCRGAITEYKRFVYLASISDTPITPSIIVDEVWHLHLTFSRCYWDEMCGKLLGYQLHHDPAMPTEQGTMHDQYLSTHDLYEQHFGEAPPSEFWPLKCQQVEVKEAKGGKIGIVLAAVSSFFLTATAAASDSESMSYSEWLFWIILAMVGFVLVRSIARSNSSTGRRRNRRYSRRTRSSSSGTGIAACSVSSASGRDCGSSDSGSGPSCGGGASCGGGGCGGGGCGGG